MQTSAVCAGSIVAVVGPGVGVGRRRRRSTRSWSISSLSWADGRRQRRAVGGRAEAPKMPPDMVMLRQRARRRASGRTGRTRVGQEQALVAAVVGVAQVEWTVGLAGRARRARARSTPRRAARRRGRCRRSRRRPRASTTTSARVGPTASSAGAAIAAAIGRHVESRRRGRPRRRDARTRPRCAAVPRRTAPRRPRAVAVQRRGRRRDGRADQPRLGAGVTHEGHAVWASRATVVRPRVRGRAWRQATCTAQLFGISPTTPSTKYVSCRLDRGVVGHLAGGER